MELFDVVNALFDRKKWSSVIDKDKEKFYFMINRFISIGYPIEANKFNNVNCNKARTLDYWNIILTNKHSKAPNWVFTSANKSEAAKSKFSKEIVNYYLKKYRITQEDFTFLELNFFEELKIELKPIETLIKENGVEIL